MSGRSVSPLGNLAGVVIGQIAGDVIVKLNTAKITPATTPGEAEQLHSHPGFLIWLGMILAFYVVGVVIEKAGSVPAAKTK